MYIPGLSELPILLKKDKKKVFNTEVIAKNEKKFEEVRNQVNLLLKQASKDVTCYDLVKSVNQGAIILNTKTNFHRNERNEKNKKFECSTPKKSSRKRRLSCTSEENYNNNEETISSPLKEDELPKVFSTKSKELIKESRKNKRLRTVSSSTANDMNTSYETELSSTINEHNSTINSSKSKSENTSTYNMNTTNVSEISSTKSVFTKLKSATKTKRKTRSKKTGIIRLENNTKKLAENIAKDSEVKKLKHFEKIYKIFNSAKECKKKKKSISNDLRNVSIPFWNTYSYLVKEIERCILRNDWNNLTKLLVALSDAPKRYQPFFLKASLINFICNPAAQESDLEQFLQECFSCHSQEDIQKVLTKLFHVVMNKKKEEDSKVDLIDNNNLNSTFDSIILSMEY